MLFVLEGLDVLRKSLPFDRMREGNCLRSTGYFVFFFWATQRLTCPWRILSRASALSRDFFGADWAAVPFGRPGPRFIGASVVSNAFARSNRAISASISARMLSIKVVIRLSVVSDRSACPPPLAAVPGAAALVAAGLPIRRAEECSFGMDKGFRGSACPLLQYFPVSEMREPQILAIHNGRGQFKVAA